MSHPVPKRRWLRFSLRTVFMAVTIVALWLAWRTGDISERQMMRQSILAKQGYVLVDPDVADGPPVAAIPRWRVALGDEAADFIAVPASWTDAELTRTKRLFPEAQVLRMKKAYPARIDRRWKLRP